MNILDRVTKLREERGWSQNQLAKKSGMAQSTISNLYSRNNEPTFQTIESICKGLGISLLEFFNVDNQECTYLTQEQRQLLIGWANLTEAQRQGLLQFLQVKEKP